MNQGYISLSSVRPWWLRLLILSLISSPLFIGIDHHASIQFEHLFSDMGNWIGYSVFIWIFIYMCVGINKLTSWLGLGAILGLVIIVTGVALPNLGIWDAVSAVFGEVQPESQIEKVQRELDLIFRLIMIMTSFPFFMLAIQSFSAAGIFNAAVRRGASGGAYFYIVIAVFLRVFQHVFEVFEKLLMAWQEENPRLVLPRHRADLGASVLSPLKITKWWWSSTWIWCQALLIHSLLFVPVAVRDWQQFIDRR